MSSKGHDTLAGLTSYLGQVSSLASQGIIIVKLQPHMLFMRQEGHFHELLFLLQLQTIFMCEGHHFLFVSR